MGGGQSHEISASACEEHAEGTLINGLPQGRYRDAEGGGKRAMELDELPVEWGIEARELSTGEERFEFPNGHFDVVKAGLGKDLSFRIQGDGLRVLEGHLQGLDTYRHHQGAEGRVLSYIGEGEWHHSGEPQPSPFKVFFEASKDVVPDGRDGMTVYGAQFAPEGLGVGALALGPGRAGLKDETLAAVQAVRISVGVCIVLGQAGPVDLVLGHPAGKNVRVWLAQLEEMLGDAFDDQGGR